MNSILRWLQRDNYKLPFLFVLFWAPVILFFKIAGEIVERDPIKGDTDFLYWLHSFANPFLDMFFLIITNTGGLIGMTLITAALAGFFVYRRNIRTAVFLLVGVGGATLANATLKVLFQRERPSLFSTEVVEKSFSFPSGHAMASSALVMCLILLTWNTKWRWVTLVGGIIFVVLVGLSRNYFGVHYPSDVVAGWSASIAWVLIVYFAMKNIVRRKPVPKTVRSEK